MNARRVAAILVVLLAVLVSIGVAVISRRQARIDEQIAAIRAAGDPAFLIDLERKAIDPNTNAATYLSAVAEDAQSLLSSLPLAYADEFDWKVVLGKQQSEQMAACFAKYPKVLEALDRVTNCTEYAWPIDYSANSGLLLTSFLSSSQHPRAISRVYLGRARYFAALGQPDKAAQTTLDQLRLCRLQDQEPLMVTFLVNIACRTMSLEALHAILRSYDLKPQTHAAIEQELAQHDALQSFVRALKSERAFGNEMFDDGAFHVVLTGEWENYLQVMQQQIELGTKSQYELVDVDRVPAKAMTQAVLPSINGAREAMNRTRAVMRCLRIFNAIQAHHKTATVVKIDDLGLPFEATIDPFTGKPLVVQSTSDGWLIYSVGTDLHDDGGQVQDFTDVGIGPPRPSID